MARFPLQQISDRDRELDEYKDTVIKLKETIKSKDQQIEENQLKIKRLEEEMSNFNEQLRQNQLESDAKTDQKIAELRKEFMGSGKNSFNQINDPNLTRLTVAQLEK